MLGRKLQTPLIVASVDNPFDTSSFDPEEFEDGQTGEEMLAKDVAPYVHTDDAWDATF